MDVLLWRGEGLSTFRDANHGSAKLTYSPDVCSQIQKLHVQAIVELLNLCSYARYIFFGCRRRGESFQVFFDGLNSADLCSDLKTEKNDKQVERRLWRA